MKRAALFIALLLALCLFTSCGEEELRYNVTEVKLDVSHCMTRDEYNLTNSEINEFLDALSGLDFGKLEIDNRPEFRDGGTVINIVIKAESESWNILLNDPYLYYDDVYYTLESSPFYEIFTTVRDIEKAHHAD